MGRIKTKGLVQLIKLRRTFFRSKRGNLFSLSLSYCSRPRLQLLPGEITLIVSGASLKCVFPSPSPFAIVIFSGNDILALLFSSRHACLLFVHHLSGQPLLCLPSVLPFWPSWPPTLAFLQGHIRPRHHSTWRQGFSSMQLCSFRAECRQTTCSEIAFCCRPYQL